jgi:hypothetical protein
MGTTRRYISADGHTHGCLMQPDYTAPHGRTTETLVGIRKEVVTGLVKVLSWLVSRRCQRTSTDTFRQNVGRAGQERGVLPLR